MARSSTRAGGERWMRYERRSDPLLPMGQFAARLLRHVVAGSAIIAVALAIGIAGYHWIAGLEWIDALLNASMILGGMGPVDRLKDEAAPKVFASLYALFSGLVLVGASGIVLAPLLHRILHKLHLDDDG